MKKILMKNLFVITSCLFLISCDPSTTQPDGSTEFADFIEIGEAQKGPFTYNSKNFNNAIASHKITITIKEEIGFLYLGNIPFTPIVNGAQFVFDEIDKANFVDPSSRDVFPLIRGENRKIDLYRLMDRTIFDTLDNFTIRSVTFIDAEETRRLNEILASDPSQFFNPSFQETIQYKTFTVNLPFNDL